MRLILRNGGEHGKIVVGEASFSDARKHCYQKHLCGTCAYKVFVGCPKVTDIHKEMLRRGTYPFIGAALQTFNGDGELVDFYVFECRRFRRPSSRPSKTEADEE